MWNIIYLIALAASVVVSFYYAYLWGFTLKSFILIGAMLVFGYMMGQMVDRLWFGSDD